MTRLQNKKLQVLGPFSLSQAKEIGLDHRELSKLVAEEKILRLERGIYLHPKAKVTREIDFQIAHVKFGSDSAIGGMTALFYYNLIEQVPGQVWVLVSPTKRVSSKNYRLIRTKTRLDVGIIEKDGYRIVSLERAIIEGFKLATKIGERTALRACRTAIQQKQTTLKKIGSMAEKLGMSRQWTKHFEAVLGSIQ